MIIEYEKETCIHLNFGALAEKTLSKTKHRAKYPGRPAWNSFDFPAMCYNHRL